MGDSRSSAQKLSQLASQHVPELDKILGELQALDTRAYETLCEVWLLA